MAEPEGLNYAEQLLARIMIATQSGEKKEDFLDAADPEGNLSSEVRETIGAVFDVFVDAVSDNIEKFDPNDPISSAANIVLEHFQNLDNLKEAADTIFKETGLDLGNLTPNDKSDDPTQQQMNAITAAITKGIDGLRNPPPKLTVDPETVTPEIEPSDGLSSLDKGYEKGVDGTAFTTEVAALEAGGKPDVNFENGVTIGELPIVSFFAQNVSPEPENVTLVNAMAPKSDITLDVPVISTAENEQSIQTLV